MVVTRTYRPSDVEAVEILKRVKAQLGISGKIDTLEERRKAYYYLKRKGWNMSMLACNPDAYSGNPEKKALCMLLNEMRGYQIKESIRGNEAQLKRYGSAFRKTYERNRKILEVQKKAVESAYKKSGMAQLMEKKMHEPKVLPIGVPKQVLEKLDRNTGVKSVPTPQPRPSTVVRKVTATSTAVEVHEPEKKNRFGLVTVLGVVAVFLILRKVMR